MASPARCADSSPANLLIDGTHSRVHSFLQFLLVGLERRINMTDTASLEGNCKSKEDVKVEEVKVETKEGSYDSAAAPPPLNIDSSGNESDEDATPPSLKDRLVKVWWEYEFLFMVIVAICIARAYPPLGAEFVYPDITATWIAVMLIFGKSCGSACMSTPSSLVVSPTHCVQSWLVWVLGPKSCRSRRNE